MNIQITVSVMLTANTAAGVEDAIMSAVEMLDLMRSHRLQF